MKFVHYSGDLLNYLRDGTVSTIAHCCNCQGIMGAGIAAQIKEEFPLAWQAYITQYREDKLRLGGVTYAIIPGDKTIINLHGQLSYGGRRAVNYEAIYTSLEIARGIIQISGGKNIGVPFKMGCDRAGGDWNVILAMLESVFRDTSIDVVIVTYAKN